jgi:hypothetical protein
VLGKAALLLGIAAVATGEPTAFGTARLGSLIVTASVLVNAKAADMRAVWNDTKVPCTVSRPLEVRVLVDRVPSGKTKRIVRSGTFADTNCAEGGPNVGFTIKARSVGLACANGRWKPGLYHFLTRATEPKRHLQAQASLDWTNTRRC